MECTPPDVSWFSAPAQTTTPSYPRGLLWIHPSWVTSVRPSARAVPAMMRPRRVVRENLPAEKKVASALSVCMRFFVLVVGEHPRIVSMHARDSEPCLSTPTCFVQTPPRTHACDVAGNKRPVLAKNAEGSLSMLLTADRKFCVVTCVVTLASLLVSGGVGCCRSATGPYGPAEVLRLPSG